MNILLGGDSTDGDMWFGLFVLFLILTIVFVVLYAQNNGNQTYLGLLIGTSILAIASYTNIEPVNKTTGSTDTSASDTSSIEFSP